MKILTAKYLLPISSEIVFEGAVAVEKDKIAAVGTREQLTRRYAGATYEDFGEAVIMPGLVNCHSHLEITAMRGYLDHYDNDFSSWLVGLTKAREEKLTQSEIKISAIWGALEGAKAGVTCFGDIARSGVAALGALQKTGLRGVLFQETEFSPDNKTAKHDFDELREKFSELKADKNDLVEVGISPHSPYTVSSELLKRIADYAVQNDIKISIHAAESADEHDLLKEGKGFFAKIYKDYDVNWDHPKCSSIQYLSNIGVLDASPLIAHCVTVSEKDIDTIKKSKSSIAHCPKSNAKFGHGVAPFESFLDSGIPVGFGSDSMASNNSCDIFEESRFAALFARTREDRNRFIHAKEIVETATLGGAKALGLERKIGTFEVGKQADLIVVGLDAAYQKPVYNVYSTLLFSTYANDVSATMVAGDYIYRDGETVKVNEAEISVRIGEIAKKLSET